MINVLLPSMGDSLFFKESYFPKPLIEINGQTMLETVVSNFEELKEKRFTFIFSQKDCSEFHLDDSANILTNGESNILVLKNQTAGALCTCLMALEYYNNDTPLIIANCDQIIDVDYNKVISSFEERELDAGLILFPSIHPRWSYAKLWDNEEVIEVAEKRPLSKNAIAGFYFFKTGRSFVEAAKSAIIKDNCVNGRFYISSSINELILMNKKVGYYEINKDAYHSFYSPEKIAEYTQKK